MPILICEAKLSSELYISTHSENLSLQMAFELYGMLAGNVSPMTGENVKPAYGGEEEAFLRKVVTPIYQVIARVKPIVEFSFTILFHHIW